MVKAGKFYCHAEDIEPNMTVPFALDPGLTFTEVADKFCQKYNTKNAGSLSIDSSKVEIKVGSKMLDLGDVVSDSVSAGDDVFILCSSARSASSSSSHNVPDHDPIAPGPASDSMPTQPPAQPLPPAAASQQTRLPKKHKVYFHYEGGVAERDPTATQAFQVEFAETTVGELLNDFVLRYNEKHQENQLDMYTLCARNDSQVIIAVDAPISKTIPNGDDVWVVPLSEAAKEDNVTTSKADLPGDANGVDRSNLRAKDKSYYYWAKKPVGEQPAPKEAPKQIRTREATRDETIQFQTISKYAFDSEGSFVSVYITMPGIQDHPKDKFEFESTVRTVSFRVMGYNNFNHRLQVPKLSEDIDPSKSTFKIKKDMVVLKLAKVKKEHHWYELHKTKGIGE